MILQRDEPPVQPSYVAKLLTLKRLFFLTTLHPTGGFFLEPFFISVLRRPLGIMPTPSRNLCSFSKHFSLHRGSIGKCLRYREPPAMGWLENCLFSVTSDKPWGPLACCWVIIH